MSGVESGDYRLIVGQPKFVLGSIAKFLHTLHPKNDANPRRGSWAEKTGLKPSTIADRHVAMRVRELRIARGLTQAQFAEMIGVVYQAHKYEFGITRISAGLLWDIARALSTPVDYFFDGIDDTPFELPPCSRRLADMKLGEIRDTDT